VYAALFGAGDGRDVDDADVEGADRERADDRPSDESEGGTRGRER
jgi:hypothetical protein